MDAASTRLAAKPPGVEQRDCEDDRRRPSKMEKERCWNEQAGLPLTNIALVKDATALCAGAAGA